MRTIKQSAVLCVFGVLLILTLAPAQAVGNSPGRRMSRVARVRIDPAVMPLDFKTVMALLRSDAVAGHAAVDVLDAEPGQGGDFCRAEPLPSDEAGVVSLALEIHLPDGVKMAAGAFGDALIENLRAELRQVFGAQVKELQGRLKRGKDEVERAQKEYTEAVEQGMPDEGEVISLYPDNEMTYRQLDETVDLSGLSPEMPFAEAVRVLRLSVDPPLRIVVLWKDLLDNAEIEPTTPIDMDGLAAVRLDAGLKALLNAVAGGFTQLDYVIDGGAITVATIDSLPALQMEARVHRVPAMIRAMRQTKPLARLIIEVVDPESWFDLSDFGEGTIQPIGEAALLIRQTRANHREIQQFMRDIAAASPVTLPVDVSQETLGGQMRLLLSYRDKLQVELADLEQRHADLERARAEAEERHSRNSWDSVSDDLQAIVYDLQVLRTAIASKTLDRPGIDEIDRAIGKARACLERSRKLPPALRPFTLSDLGSPWDPSPETRTFMERLSSQRAALRAVTDRIAEIDRLLAGPRVLEPEVDRIRHAAGRLQKAITQVEDLRQRLAHPRAPSVTILGGID